MKFDSKVDAKVGIPHQNVGQEDKTLLALGRRCCPCCPCCPCWWWWWWWGEQQHNKDDDADDDVAPLDSWQWKWDWKCQKKTGGGEWNENGKLRNYGWDCEKTFECHLCSSFEYFVNSKLRSWAWDSLSEGEMERDSPPSALSGADLTWTTRFIHLLLLPTARWLFICAPPSLPPHGHCPFPSRSCKGVNIATKILCCNLKIAHLQLDRKAAAGCGNQQCQWQWQWGSIWLVPHSN